MEGEHDNNHEAPQVPESQARRRIADFLDSAPVGLLKSDRRAKLAFARRRTHSDIWRGGRAVRRTGGNLLA